MTLTDELKVLEDKIKSNQDQYDLEREAAKISALSSKELDKYIYFKFEYSSLVFSEQRIKKDDKGGKVLKYNNDLVYKSVHNFNKYSVLNFNEISSINSKFETLNKFYKDFKKLKAVKCQTKETKQKKITVLKNALSFMMSC